MQKPTKAAVNSPEAIKPVGTKLKFEKLRKSERLCASRLKWPKWRDNVGNNELGTTLPSLLVGRTRGKKTKFNVFAQLRL